MRVSTKLWLDARVIASDGCAPIKITIRYKGKVAMLPTGVRVRPDQWNDTMCCIFNRKDAATLNVGIQWMKSQVDALFLQLTMSGELRNYDANGLRALANNRVLDGGANTRVEKKKLFVTRFEKFMERKSEGTRRIYAHTLSRMRAFDPELGKKRFEDITLDWLKDFDVFLLREGSPSKNARNIHLRNIRAVFNDAIDSEITAAYPFRRFKIRPEATLKRSLSIEELREFWFFEPEPCAVKYHDLWKLTFLLIGINLKDLHGLTGITKGRIEYTRAKTHKPYSIKVEPEAQEIIDEYRGDKHLLVWGDTYANPQDLLRRVNRALANIGPVKIGKQGKKTYKPLQPQLTTYWARHTWATIASSLDIPRDTIAHALGHGNNTITDIYIDFDRSKVDEANRRVIDWVLYGKK